MKIRILIVNINNAQFTRDLLEDLAWQSEKFALTIVDQNSTERGTTEMLDFAREVFPYVKIKINQDNISLCAVWNKFYAKSREPYLCFLNNDTRISRHFVRDTLDILDDEPKVGAVIHATNHPKYQETKDTLQYRILREKIVQGWDFTIRRKAYVQIPDDFGFFGGDDWLFTKLYVSGWNVAAALSSPIIHYKAKSRRYYEGDRKREEEIVRGKYGIERLSYRSRYCRMSPTFEMIKEKVYERKGV